MNNIITLFSLLRGRKNLRFLNMFSNRRTNNGRMILWSLVGLTALGVIGRRNKDWGQKMQNSLNNLRNQPKLPIQNKLNFANEYSAELLPALLDKYKK